KQHLEGAPPVLQLPTDRARPPVQTYRGGSQRFGTGAELLERLTWISRKEAATVYMLLMAAFRGLLHRMTGEEQIVIGTPVANRATVETERLIGLFVNSLAVKTEMGGDPTFKELLRRERGVILGAYAHQDLPFGKLVEAIQPERVLSHSPIFQVMFALQNA